jgi:hypothetical protein
MTWVISEALVDAFLEFQMALHLSICRKSGLTLNEYECLETVAASVCSKRLSRESSATITGLIAKGLLERKPSNQNDSWWRVTETGIRLLRKARSISFAAIEDSIADLTEIDRRLLRKVRGEHQTGRAPR